MVSYLKIMKAKAFHLGKVHIRPLLTKASDHCDSSAGVDHMMGLWLKRKCVHTPPIK